MLTRIEMIRSEILSERIMVDYMKSIYSLVTVNIAHLCAEMIYQLLQRYKQREVSRDFFARVLYFSIKKLQISPGVFFHRGLLDPDRYGSLLDHVNRDLRDFFLNASASELVKETDDCYHFQPALEKEYEFDEIRIRNFIKVRHNETRPIPAIEQSVHEVFTHFDQLNSPRSLAAMFYDDDKRSYERDRSIFCNKRYDEINREERQTLAGDPFFLVPEQLTHQKVGVLLIHGFTASPAEMRPLGDFLCEKGLFAYGVRLKGHGTSPCDLDFRTSDQWFRSVLRGWDVLQHSCEKIFVAGFSMGGCLALKLAMEKSNEIAGIISIATSLRIRNKNIIFANLVNQINKLAASLPYVDGIKRFKKGNSENPEINYLNVPISAIQEFKKLMDQTEKCLDEIYQPILIVQGTEDPTVDPVSAELIAEGISSHEKKMLTVDSDRHVIVLDKGSLVHQEIYNFITELTQQGREERIA
jgi:esterase/lipase